MGKIILLFFIFSLGCSRTDWIFWHFGDEIWDGDKNKVDISSSNMAAPNKQKLVVSVQSFSDNFIPESLSVHLKMP